MSQLTDHPLRYALSNELHARPFPVVTAPSHAVYLALKPTQNAAARDRPPTAPTSSHCSTALAPSIPSRAPPIGSAPWANTNSNGKVTPNS